MENTQTPDPIVDALPTGWKMPVAIGLLILPYLTRAYYAIKQGGGLRGIWRAIWFGTNTPKIIAVLLCSSVLFSCTSTNNIAGTKINSVEVSGSKVIIDGTSRLNISAAQADSTIAIITKNVFVIKSITGDSLGVEVNWIVTTPSGNK